MKIFTKLKKKYPVDRVFVVRQDSTIRNFCDLHPSAESMHLLPCFAIEFHKVGLAIVECIGEKIVIDIRLSFYNRSAKLLTRMLISDSIKSRDNTTRTMTIAVVDVIGEIAATTQPSIPSPKLDAGRLIVWERKGDTLVYRKIHKRDAREHLANYVKEIIRKRDHPVRGFYRTLPNGVKTWVRSHRRGDIELGTVIAVQELT